MRDRIDQRIRRVSAMYAYVYESQRFLPTIFIPLEHLVLSSEPSARKIDGPAPRLHRTIRRSKSSARYRFT